MKTNPHRVVKSCKICVGTFFSWCQQKKFPKSYRNASTVSNFPVIKPIFSFFDQISITCFLDQDSMSEQPLMLLFLYFPTYRKFSFLVPLKKMPAVTRWCTKLVAVAFSVPSEFSQPGIEGGKIGAMKPLEQLHGTTKHFTWNSRHHKNFHQEENSENVKNHLVFNVITNI